MLTPATDSSPARWIVDGIRGFAESVLSLVPEGYPAYVRVFHPAERLENGERVPVRWSEIAAANGTIAHPEMQLTALTRSKGWNVELQEDVFERAPDDGRLPDELIPVLIQVLREFTAAPARCWFAAWEGWGALGGNFRAAPSFDLPHRRYHLMRGPIEAYGLGVDAPHGLQTASIWWPDDHAWCVATEVDLNSTYIGCSSGCAAALEAADELEALRVDPSAGVAYDTDLLNQPHTGGD